LLPEISEYVPSSLELLEVEPDLLGPDESELVVGPTGSAPSSTETGEITTPNTRDDLPAKSTSLILEQDSTFLSLEFEKLEAPDGEPSVDEATEQLPRDRLLPMVLRLGDLRLPEPSPMPLPSRVLPGDWAMVEDESTPSGGVSAAVTDDVQQPPEELDLVPDESSVIDDDLGDLLSPVDDEPPEPLRAVRGEPLPVADSVDEESPIEVSDPGGHIASPEAWDDDDVPTRVEHPDQLAAALRVLSQEPASDPLTLGVVDGGAPPTDEDLAADGVSLDLDTESIELLSLDLLLDPPMEQHADPAVMEDINLIQTHVAMPEDDLTEPAPRGPAWMSLDVGSGPAPAHAPRLFLEILDPEAEVPPSEPTLRAPPGPKAAASPEPSTPPPAEAPAHHDGDELELEEVDRELPPLDDRLPEDMTGDSVDELLIFEDEDTGPSSLVLEMETESVADLLAEGGAIRVELGLGDKPAASPEEARQGVAVGPARPLRRWDGRSGDSGERATDLVALARLQKNSGKATRAAPPAQAPETEADEDLEVEEPGDDWLADVNDEDAAPKAAPGHDKGDPMSPYYEDTMPGWLPGDAEGATRGAPRSDTTDISPPGRSGKKNRRV
jgi:hypothetical protein